MVKAPMTGPKSLNYLDPVALYRNESLDAVTSHAPPADDLAPPGRA